MAPAGILRCGGWLCRLDQKVVGALQGGRRPRAVAAARAVSALAEPVFASVVLAAFAAGNVRRDGWRAACAPCLAVASGMALRRELSHVIARPRPPADLWLTQPEGFSFPSKHTTLAVLTAAACNSSGRGLPRYAASLLAAVGVGAGRVYLGVHWPTDIVAGWLFAEGWLRLVGACCPGQVSRSDRPRRTMRQARRDR